MLSYLVSSSRSIQIHSDCLHSKSATSAPILPPPRAHTLSLSLSSLLSPSFRANPYSSSQFRDLESSRQKSPRGVSGPRKFSTETPPGHIGTSKAPDRNPPPGRIRTSKVLDRNSRGPIGTSINSRPQKRFIACVPPLLFVSGPRNRFHWP
jgi:hypothetical protein